jgi:hypothetical protein
MSEFEPDTTTPAEQPECEPAGRGPRWQRVLKAVAITFFSVIGFLVFAAFMLYNFGGMSGSVHPELFAQYDQAVAAGQAAPIQKRLVIPIPGCKCHSTDPTLTALHSRRHMNECGKCHNTKPAHMEPGIL